VSIKTGWEGRYFEDFEVSDIYKHPYGRTVTETDNAWFTNLTLNTNASHFNVEYARQMGHEKTLVNSAFTLALVTGMSVIDVSENAFANLGWDEVRLPAPVYPGDTLYSETEVLDKRESKSRPNVGILFIKTRGLKQDGTVVIEFKRTIMVYKRADSPRKNIFPVAKERSEE
jgi:itaconyl-CoA hydratase